MPFFVQSRAVKMFQSSSTAQIVSQTQRACILLLICKIQSSLTGIFIQSIGKKEPPFLGFEIRSIVIRITSTPKSDRKRVKKKVANNIIHCVIKTTQLRSKSPSDDTNLTCSLIGRRMHQALVQIFAVRSPLLSIEKALTTFIFPTTEAI